MKHEDFTYCPLQKMLTHEQIQNLLTPGHNHTLGDNCLMSQIINTDENLRLDTIAILFNSYSKANALRKRQNEKLEQDKELSNKQITTISSIIESFLAPQQDGTYRCSQCKNCTNCAPIHEMTRKSRLDLIKSRENYEIQSNVSIIRDPQQEGKLRILAKLPVLEEEGNKQSNDNLKSIVAEFAGK